MCEGNFWTKYMHPQFLALIVRLSDPVAAAPSIPFKFKFHSSVLDIFFESTGG
jgi:hypothetical protein